MEDEESRCADCGYEGVGDGGLCDGCRNPGGEAPPGWVLTEPTVDRVLARLGAIDDECDTLDRQYAAMKFDLIRQREEVLESYWPAVEEWAARRIAERGGPGKSVKLLHGTLQFRTVGGGLCVTDEAAAIRHVEQAGLHGMLRTKISLEVRAYLEFAEKWARADNCGELLPGVSDKPPVERLYRQREKGKASVDGE